MGLLRLISKKKDIIINKKQKKMHIFNFALYTLILSYNPCDVFKYYKVTEMHGLNFAYCERYHNNEEHSYISSWCNLSPSDNKPFIFIDLSRCVNDSVTKAMVYHEVLQLSRIQYDVHCEPDKERMLFFVENETNKVVDLVNKKRQKHINLMGVPRIKQGAPRGRRAREGGYID